MSVWINSTKLSSVITPVFRNYINLFVGKSLNNVEFNAIAYIAQELARYISTYDDLHFLKLGVEDLVHGQLTPRLLPAATLKAALANISEELDHYFLHLCVNTSAEVYALQNFSYTTRANGLFLRISLPYCLKRNTNIFRLHSFAVPVPGQQGLTTRIKDLPRYVIHTDNSFGILDSEPLVAVVDTSAFKWLPKSQLSILSHGSL